MHQVAWFSRSLIYSPIAQKLFFLLSFPDASLAWCSVLRALISARACEREGGLRRQTTPDT